MKNPCHGNVLVAVLIFITLTLSAAGGLYLWQTRLGQPPTRVVSF